MFLLKIQIKQTSAYLSQMILVICSRYIYIPLGGSRKGVIRQIAASFCAFAFIWQWHGGHTHTLWWFIPNWLGVVVESLAGMVLALPSVRRLEVGIISFCTPCKQYESGEKQLVMAIAQNKIYLQCKILKGAV